MRGGCSSAAGPVPSPPPGASGPIPPRPGEGDCPPRAPLSPGPAGPCPGRAAAGSWPGAGPRRGRVKGSHCRPVLPALCPRCLAGGCRVSRPGWSQRSVLRGSAERCRAGRACSAGARAAPSVLSPAPARWSVFAARPWPSARRVSRPAGKRRVGRCPPASAPGRFLDGP